MRSYAEIQDLIEQMLQDTSNATYDTTELGYWIEESLKELATYVPHIVRVPFKIESRTGSATSTSSNNLIDATNDQFLATDDDNEKVVYNTTDKTWAVITSYSTAEQVGLSNDIMESGESYKIFNKHCYTNKQVFIGDVGDYLWVDGVEYKTSKWPRNWRNWRLYGNVLEIDIDFGPTNTNDVNVHFAKPHRLCQLADLVGEVHTEGAADATTLQVKYFTDDQIIEVGDEFYITGHRTLYTVTTGVTLDLQTSTGKQIGFFPGLEAIAPAGNGITFTKSTLQPQHEELFCHLVAARAVLSDNIRHINAIPKGGADVWRRYQEWGERKLAEALGKLARVSVPRTKRTWPKD